MTAVFSDELRARVEADFGRVVDLLGRKVALKSISAEGITAGDVLRATEGGCAPVACLEDGAEACPRRSECVAVNFWRGLDRTIEGYVDGVTLADLVKMG